MSRWRPRKYGHKPNEKVEWQDKVESRQEALKERCTRGALLGTRPSQTKLPISREASPCTVVTLVCYSEITPKGRQTESPAVSATTLEPMIKFESSSSQ